MSYDSNCGVKIMRSLISMSKYSYQTRSGQSSNIGGSKKRECGSIIPKLVGDHTQQAEINASSKLRTTIEVALKLLKTCQKPVGNENDSSYNVTTEESQLGITIFEYSVVFFSMGGLL